MDKIFVHKNDTAREILDEILASESLEVTLVIPRNAGLKDTVANFHFLKREATAEGKTITIESVDEEVLALAKASRMAAIHPLFQTEHHGRSLSDIVPFVRGIKEARAMSRRKKKAVALTVEEGDNQEYRSPSHKKRSIAWKIVFIIAAATIIVVGAVLVVNRSFAKAEIVVRFKKIPWNFSGTVVADTAVSSLGATDLTIPAQLFRETKTITQFFPASSRAQIQQKASGNITIYNAYSSVPQTLVATTRFVTPDGLIFRLSQTVVVPGAKITDGKIIPSSIVAPIAADKPGPTYNVTQVAKLSVPGFKGTPRYAGFYGTIDHPISGGFIGEKAVPTKADIVAAQDQTTAVLKATFENNFLQTKPQGFTLIDGASDFHVTKLTVNPETNTDGKFSVFGEAEFRSLAVREEDVKTLLLRHVAQDYTGKQFESFTSSSYSFSNVKPNFEKKQLSVIVAADGILTSVFDVDTFRGTILGLEEAKVGSLIRALPDLSDGKVSLWPFWLKRVPSNPAHVHMIVQ